MRSRYIIQNIIKRLFADVTIIDAYKTYNYEYPKVLTVNPPLFCRGLFKHRY